MINVQIADRNALLAAMDANLVAFWSAYGRANSCTLEQVGQGVWFYTGVAHPLFNGVVSTVFQDAHVDTAIHGLQGAIDTGGAPAFWWVSPRATPADLSSRLAALGIQQVGEVPGMALDLARLDAAAAAVADLTIRPVDTSDQQALWAEVAGEGTGFPQVATDRVVAIERTLSDAGYRSQRRYLGFIGNAPVACSAMVLEAGVAGIYAVATIPSARRKGFGRAMTAFPLAQARELGYTTAILQSSALGYPVYQKLGFEQVCAYRLHLQTKRPPAAGG